MPETAEQREAPTIASATVRRAWRKEGPCTAPGMGFAGPEDI